MPKDAWEPQTNLLRRQAQVPPHNGTQFHLSEYSSEGRGPLASPS